MSWNSNPGSLSLKSELFLLGWTVSEGMSTPGFETGSKSFTKEISQLLTMRSLLMGQPPRLCGWYFVLVQSTALREISWLWMQTVWDPIKRLCDPRNIHLLSGPQLLHL